MRFYACVACKTSFQVAGEIKELQHLWSVIESGGRPACPSSLCQGRLVSTETHVAGFAKKEIPLQSFFRGIHGFGSPDGEAASLEKFMELIISGKIAEVHAEPVGQPERVILKRLIMEDGTRLHFDASARGACCYYIEQPGPSCVEVVENELTHVDPAEASSKSVDSDREEVGRTSEASGSGECTRCEPGGELFVSTAAELSGTKSVSAVSATCEVPAGPDSRSDSDGNHSC